MQLSESYVRYGKIKRIVGLKIEIIGLNDIAEVGGCIQFHCPDRIIKGEVVGIQEKCIIAMPYGDIVGMHEGIRVDYLSGNLKIAPNEKWAGRVINGAAMPIDDLGSLPVGDNLYSIKNRPPVSFSRRLVKDKVDLGVKAINTFLTCCHGQRMGIFAGSGVGKTVLLSQLTRFTECDYVVIGLIGERGREVGEFLHTVLGPEMQKKAIIIVETSDSPALLRRQAAYVTLTVAESLRDKGYNVLCMIDSLTRFAFAQREIGLAAGEPPTSKGYPPTVFNELPSLLERAGPGTSKQGNITGIFTVLVEGDDLQDPIADTVRSILDGHIVLDRKLAEKGHYPAINILKSISRTVPACQEGEHRKLAQKARKFISDYDSMEDMIMLGAYKKGASEEIDQAIMMHPKIVNYLKQGIDEKCELNQGLELLQDVIK